MPNENNIRSILDEMQRMHDDAVSRGVPSLSLEELGYQMGRRHARKYPLEDISEAIQRYQREHSQH